MKTFKKLSLLFLATLAFAQPILSNDTKAGYVQRLKDFASATNANFITPIYQAESIRTAVTRSAMAVTCLADGVCSSSDMSIIALAAASILTAASYNANSQRRYKWLPEKLNLLADGIATVASYDASWLPITGSELEAQVRATIGYMSTITTGISFLPS